MRRHGWQLPLHPLQFVGMGVFTFLVVFFYVFLGPFLGNRTAESAVLTLFSFTVFSIAALYIRCTAIDPSDQTIYRKKRKVPKFNSRSIAVHLILRITKKIEHKILKCCIRRKYLNPWNINAQMDTVMPFSFLVMDDTITPQVKDDEITFCSLCDFEVKRCSKHCRTCNRCVDGFDHHCRWLNNCIGRRNYTTFILLLVFTMLMLALEAGSAAAIFIRCFASKSISMELKHKLHTEFPKEILAAISVLLAALTAYISAALGQLFIFHVELIRKGMRTYDYILAMREESRQSIDHLDDFDLSSDDSDYESPRNSKFISRFLCNGHKEKQVISLQNSQELFNPANSEKHEIKIDPWKLIRMSKEKANMAAKNARERLVRQKQIALISPLKPLPLEKKKGPIEITKEKCGITQDASNLWISSSTGMRFSSPRRRFSSSPSQKCKSDFDLKLMETSKEIETCIYV